MNHKTQIALVERGLQGGLAGFGVDVKVKKLKLNMAGGRAVASGVFEVPGKSEKLEVEARYKLPITADIICSACEACGRQLAQKVRAWTFGRVTFNGATIDAITADELDNDGQMRLIEVPSICFERPDEDGDR